MSRISLGVDIEEVRRFKKLVRNKNFLSRVFTPREVQYCLSKKRKLQHFAVRFAAKEAVWKALSDSVRIKKTKLGHRDIGIKNNSRGKPGVVLPLRLARLSRKISISLSHTNSYAVAVALVRM